jgi:hypothetical protein
MSALKSDFHEKLGLLLVHSGHSQIDLEADINLLGHAYLMDHHHIYTASRSQSFEAIDAFARGGERLGSAALKKILTKYLED